MNQWQGMVGKTIKEIDESCVNFVRITFEDGSEAEIYAECGNNPLDFPFFEVSLAE